MIVPKLPDLEGVLWPPGLLARYGPDLLPLVEREYRQDGRPVPPDLRTLLEEMDKMGRAYLLAELAKRAQDLRLGEASLDKAPSLPAPSVTMTAKQVAEIRGTTPRAVQMLAKNGKIPATKTARGEWLIDAAALETEVS